jgi:predicted nucleic acid-binding protein
MSGYLLDTNVISELARARPHPDATAWLRSAGDCYLSVLTTGELRRGVWMLQRRDPLKAARIGEWVEMIVSEYADRVLPVDESVAERWATLSCAPDPAGR